MFRFTRFYLYCISIEINNIFKSVNCFATLFGFIREREITHYIQVRLRNKQQHLAQQNHMWESSGDCEASKYIGDPKASTAYSIRVLTLFQQAACLGFWSNFYSGSSRSALRLLRWLPRVVHNIEISLLSSEYFERRMNIANFLFFSESADM